MVLRIKKYDILEVHWKIWLLGGGVTKNSIEGGELFKGGRGLGQFADLMGRDLARKRGVVLLMAGGGGDAHYNGGKLR